MLAAGSGQLAAVAIPGLGSSDGASLLPGLESGASGALAASRGRHPAAAQHGAAPGASGPGSGAPPPGTAAGGHWGRSAYVNANT
ncbi:hypothetical protein HaLaN_19177, partial [Haematococcus lacustris]